MNPDDQDPLLEAAFAYLSDYHATLWGDWDISRPDRRRQAARWLADQTRHVLSRIPELTDPYPPATFQGPLTEPSTVQRLHDEGERLRDEARAEIPKQARKFAKDAINVLRPTRATYTAGQQAEVW